jgi:hypothetical protein
VGTAPAVVRGASTPTTERRQQSGLCWGIVGTNASRMLLLVVRMVQSMNP